MVLGRHIIRVSVPTLRGDTSGIRNGGPVGAGGGIAKGLAAFAVPTQAKLLVIVMRRLGDVLLTTPLLRTLRANLPDATIDVLTFRGTEGVLAGNPDVARVLTLSQRPSKGELAALVRSLRRRYDIAFSTQSGDRPTMLAFIAGRRRVGFVPADGKGAWWKSRALDVAVPADSENHRVVELLRLTEALGLKAQPQLVSPGRVAAPSIVPALPDKPYAVLHPNPMYRFRRWSDEGWRSLAHALRERGLAVIVTGGPDADERAYLDNLWGPVAPAVQRFDGRLDWPQLASLIGNAKVYVGTDTSMTHLAAATGCPTIALYGPASPHRIGPWPVGGLSEPWAPAGRVQHRGNVWVVQNPLPCLPCEKLGCDNHYLSRAQCLDELPMRQVLGAVEEALATARVNA